MLKLLESKVTLVYSRLSRVGLMVGRVSAWIIKKHE
jgi:hypothetical protein